MHIHVNIKTEIPGFIFHMDATISKLEAWSHSSTDVSMLLWSQNHYTRYCKHVFSTYSDMKRREWRHDDGFMETRRHADMAEIGHSTLCACMLPGRWRVGLHNSNILFCSSCYLAGFRRHMCGIFDTIISYHTTDVGCSAILFGWFIFYSKYIT